MSRRQFAPGLGAHLASITARWDARPLAVFGRPVVWIGLVAANLIGWYLHWVAQSARLTIGLAGLAYWSLVPAAILLVVAFAVRRVSLIVVAAVVMTISTFTFFSPAMVVGCGPSTDQAANSPSMVVYSHNVKVDVGDPVGVAEAIVAHDADVVALQETSPSFAAELLEQPNLSEYQYRAVATLPKTRLITLSRWPAGPTSIDQMSDFDASRNQMSTQIDGPLGPFTLINYHATAPVDRARIEAWAADLDQLDHQIDGPTLVAGDFNATINHAQFRQVLDAGWRDAHQSKGCGLDATWPCLLYTSPSPRD